MEKNKVEHLTYLKPSIESVVDIFIAERKAQNLADKTIEFYMCELGQFIKWLEKKSIFLIEDITQYDIREFFSELSKRRSKGGVHANYRAIKAMLRFYEYEFEPDNWRNPIYKVKIQNAKAIAKEGVSVEDVQKLINVISGQHEVRDRAIFHCLVSSGLRISEFLALNVEDINLITGAINVKHGKGDKARTTFLGKEARKALRKYLVIHPKEINAIWINDKGERLTISGIRYSLNKYAKKADIGHVTLHDFRRCFALSCYRKGVEVLLISQLLGHSTIEVTKRYLALTNDDLRLAHSKGNPLG